MNLPVIFRILGVLLMIFSCTQIPPLLVSWYYDDGVIFSFLTTFFLTLLSGFVLWAPVMHNHKELKTRDCFLVVTLFWTVLGSFGSFPFIFTESLQMSVTDSFFESISGLNHYRRHCPFRPGPAAPFYFVLPPAAAVAWRDGYYRHCCRHPAYAWHRRNAVISRGKPWAGQGQQAICPA